MSRYVDINRLEPQQFENSEVELGVLAYDYEVVQSEPYIDLVRCGECISCKRKRGTFKGEPIFFYRCKEHNRDVESDDYCSWGERRE